MDDAQIVQLLLNRDERAIPETAKKYGKYCTSIALHIIGNWEDAEECVNDAYLDAWNSIPPHRPKMLPTFLGKIIRNLSINKYKHNMAEKRGDGELPAVLDELTDCVSENDDVEQVYEYQELVAEINRFLGTLPSEKRSIFVCRYWYSDSISDIASRFKMTYAGVSMTLSRIRTELHNYLTERGYQL